MTINRTVITEAEVFKNVARRDQFMRRQFQRFSKTFQAFCAGNAFERFDKTLTQILKHLTATNTIKVRVQRTHRRIDKIAIIIQDH